MKIHLTDVTRVYLACPYSDPDPEIRTSRVRAADIAAAYLMEEKGYVVFSPLTHSHAIAEYLDNHLSHEFWLSQDASHILTCNKVIIYRIVGWDNSFGVAWEIGFATGQKISVEYLEPEVVVEWASKRGIEV